MLCLCYRLGLQNSVFNIFFFGLRREPWFFCKQHLYTLAFNVSVLYVKSIHIGRAVPITMFFFQKNKGGGCFLSLLYRRECFLKRLYLLWNVYRFPKNKVVSFKEFYLIQANLNDSSARIVSQGGRKMFLCIFMGENWEHYPGWLCAFFKKG